MVLKFTDTVWESFGKGRFSRDAMLLFLQLTLSSIGVAIFPPASNQVKFFDVNFLHQEGHSKKFSQTNAEKFY